LQTTELAFAVWWAYSGSTRVDPRVDLAPRTVDPSVPAAPEENFAGFPLAHGSGADRALVSQLTGDEFQAVDRNKERLIARGADAAPALISGLASKDDDVAALSKWVNNYN